LIQHTNDPIRRQADVDLDRQRIARIIVDRVERAIRAAIGQAVAHEVHRPALIRP
jgi:hypothetical protein